MGCGTALGRKFLPNPYRLYEVQNLGRAEPLPKATSFLRYLFPYQGFPLYDYGKNRTLKPEP